MSASEAVVLTVHLFVTAAMVGLIWLVQIVHYPLFASVGADGFPDYERQHQRRISFVVGPLMAAEGVTALWLAIEPPHGISRIWPLVGLGVLGVVQVSTVLLQVPQHNALGGGFDPVRVQRLVHTNWVRTVGWSVRGVIATGLVVHSLSR